MCTSPRLYACLVMLSVSLAFALAVCDGAALVLNALNTKISFRSFDPDLHSALDEGMEVSAITASTIPDFKRDLLAVETAVYQETESLNLMVNDLLAQMPANVLRRLYDSTFGNQTI